MFPELIVLRHLFTVLHGRWQALRADPEAAYSTEAVIVTALLAALALTAVGIIVAKVVSSANNIYTNGGGREPHRSTTDRTTTLHRGRRWPCPAARDERGAVSAELVIATPLLLLLIMGVIQFALWEHAEHIASAVAQQGVSVGRLQGETAGAGQAEAQSVLDQLGPSVLADSNITATRTATTTTVTVTGHAESIVGIFTLPVKAVAVGPNEVYTNAGAAP